ncbi:hypothetical protein EVG20_g140 [Dentipellis fragilis]|uniref:Uncharacterized protein n=1 Tax=Dentipellis fragilis TaxID=205917 RepID=A0A4Y9ZH99_9AGAM|nr:hypothetical protein EVG20_g140 [Dentipellis fragilis]
MPTRNLEPTVSFVDQSVRHPDLEPDHISIRDFEEEDDDIYRGEPPPSAARLQRAESVSSSSSSSASSFVGGRLGAIAGVVERAITHWARTNWSTSSLSSNSSASTTRSSFRTTNKSTARRRKIRTANSEQRARSELHVAARIKAREERHHVPREFALYLPPSPKTLRSPKAFGTSFDNHEQRTLRTTSLPLIISHLEAALKRSSRMARRAQHHSRIPAPYLDPDALPAFLPHQDYMLPSTIDTIQTKLRKGKLRDVSGTPSPDLSSGTPSRGKLQQAWWLDVASPTWEDMRTIGKVSLNEPPSLSLDSTIRFIRKLLHLHPLTLEDILQQEPREKLELFPRLGYHFIVFRAIESAKTRTPFDNSIDTTGELKLSGDEGTVGEVYVYLIVFREGICSFHFSDISEHIDRVRNKVLLQEKGATMSSSWIAHGILDSVVDAFFPFLEDVEKEIVNIEDIVFSYAEAESMQSPMKAGPPVPSGLKREQKGKADSEATIKDEFSVLSEEVKAESLHRTRRLRFSMPRIRYPISFCALWYYIVSSMAAFRFRRSPEAKAPPVTANVSALRRMARTRRLVTSLARVLATKSEVVARIRKRLLTPGGEYGQVDGGQEDHELAIYMGDVQDHIITLQQSLAHYERMLSQSHPTHLSNLRVAVLRGRSNSDKAIMILSTVTVAVLPAQTFTGGFSSTWDSNGKLTTVPGLFSLNITVPSNGDVHFYVFGIVIVACTAILCAYFSLMSSSQGGIATSLQLVAGAGGPAASTSQRRGAPRSHGTLSSSDYSTKKPFVAHLFSEDETTMLAKSECGAGGAGSAQPRATGL